MVASIVLKEDAIDQHMKVLVTNERCTEGRGERRSRMLKSVCCYGRRHQLAAAVQRDRSKQQQQSL
jgi:hypothetical protein